MANKKLKTSAKLAVPVVLACGVCCIPLIAPFVVGGFGIGALGAGQWVIGGALVLGMILFLLWRRKKATCGAPTAECCEAK